MTASSIQPELIVAGAGAGDPELITLKAKRLLEHADSVLYDHLANSALLDLAPASAERVYVGKKKSEHALSQEEICALLIDRAKRGFNVVRLKGGDPFIFGRGGEEAEALAEAGLRFEIVPGVTSALAAAAYAGIPLTHRSHASGVRAPPPLSPARTRPVHADPDSVSACDRVAAIRTPRFFNTGPHRL